MKENTQIIISFLLFLCALAFLLYTAGIPLGLAIFVFVVASSRVEENEKTLKKRHKSN